ncbi:MAG: hypothetical protein ABL999_08950 [Pyrinomonadaceae bacterium]
MDNQITAPNVKESVRSLLAGAIDYAGLFPPAGLSMSEAVINYAMYRNSNYRWMLGNFVVPAVQLYEFIENAGDFVSRDANAAWRLSVLAGEDLTETFHQIRDFTSKYSPGVIVDSIEVRANTVSKIANTVTSLPAGMKAYFELGLGKNFPDLLAKVAATGQFAKLRTGGVTPGAFPDSGAVIRFVRSCLAANVPFKATAGLHHPIRCFRPLTYENNAPKGTMHGFLNLFLMTGFAREAYRASLLEDVMEEEFDEVFRFADQSVTWRNEYRLNTFQIESLRKFGLHSFGSCSFDEPIADLQRLGIL